MQHLSEMLKGVLDGIVLQIISRGEIYGYKIAQELHAMGFEDLAQATVYALLLRLERNNLVNVTKRPSQIGPPRKFYTLNSRGFRELASFWMKWDFMSDRLHLLRHDGSDDNDL